MNYKGVRFGQIFSFVFAVAFLIMSLVVVHSFEFASPQSPGPDPEVINGAEVTDPSIWPATFIFRSGAGGCTSTAVGQRVILTAAHCIADGATGTVQLGGAAISVRCDHHPEYGVGNSTTDFALCLTGTVMDGILFEVVGSSIAHPRIGDPVILLGYGCVKEGGHDASFGVLHTGAADVVRLPDGSDIDIISRGGAALCFGDSGGATYINLNQSGSRRNIIGVNSRGDISQYSFISATATRSFIDWALEWSGTNSVNICGLHFSAKGCR